MNFEHVPHELKAVDQWVCWQYQADPQNPAKQRKMPIDPNTGKPAKANDAATWASYDVAVGACDASASKYAGIGFMFSEHDNFCGIDLDDCVDDAGNIRPAALRIIELANSYAELSPSGNGVHIIGLGSIDSTKKKKSTTKQPWGGMFEVYSTVRYFTVTGQHIPSSPLSINNIQTLVDGLQSAITKPAASTKPTPKPVNVDSPSLVDSAGTAFDTPYLKGWIRNKIATAIDMVASALDGNKHNQRFAAGRLLGGMVAHGVLDRDVAAQLLYDAQPPQAHIDQEMKAIYDGIDEGMQNPLEIPSPPPPTHDPMLWPLLNHANASASHGQSQPNTTNASTPAPSTVYPNALDLRTVPATNLSDAELFQLCEQGQVGAAKALQRLHPYTLAYDTSLKSNSWYLWNGQQWTRDQSSTILHVISAHVGGLWLGLATRLYTQHAATNDPSEKTALNKQITTLQRAAKELQKTKELRAIRELAASFFEVDGDKWDSHPSMLGCANGYIDLRTGQLVAPNPTYRIRKIAPTPAPTARTTPTAWLKFLGELFPSDSEYAAIPAYLKRLFGLALLGKKPDHVFAILWGEGGRNGKGTMLETLKAVLGDYADPASKDLLLDTERHRAGGAPSPHWVDLQGLRLTWASETNEGARFNMANAKFLSGGDTIKARGVHQASITFTPSHLFMLLTNDKPRANANDAAFWSRVHLIPFVYRFLHPHELKGLPNERPINTSLPDQLASESSAILGWLIEGCLEYQQAGLQPPKAVLDANAEYRDSEDTLGEFINQYLTLDATANTAQQDIYKAYCEYAEENGLGRKSKKTLTQQITPRLLSLGVKGVHRNNGLVWNGLALDPMGMAAGINSANAGNIGSYGAVGYASNSYPIDNQVIVSDSSDSSLGRGYSSITSVLDDSNHLNSNQVIDVIDKTMFLDPIEKSPIVEKTVNQVSQLSPAQIIGHYKAKKRLVIDGESTQNHLSLTITSITNAINTASQNRMQAHSLLRQAQTTAHTIASTYPNEYQALIEQIEQAAHDLGVDISKPSTLN